MAKGTKTGGRKVGTPNKVTADIRAAARKHGAACIKELARLMTKAKDERTSVAAIKEILDRAYGKSTDRHYLAMRGIDSMSEDEILEFLGGEPDPEELAKYGGSGRVH